MSDSSQAAASETTTAAPAPHRRHWVMTLLLTLCVLALLAGLLAFWLSGPRGGAADVFEGVDEDTVQAVYLTNDRVFFGDLTVMSGEWLLLEDAVYLRRTAAAKGAEGEEAASTDLVPFQQEVGGDGDMLVNAGEIVLVQNLDDGSEIARALAARG